MDSPSRPVSNAPVTDWERTRAEYSTDGSSAGSLVASIGCSPPDCGVAEPGGGVGAVGGVWLTLYWASCTPASAFGHEQKAAASTANSMAIGRGWRTMAGYDAHARAGKRKRLARCIETPWSVRCAACTRSRGVTPADHVGASRIIRRHPETKHARKRRRRSAEAQFAHTLRRALTIPVMFRCFGHTTSMRIGDAALDSMTNR